MIPVYSGQEAFDYIERLHHNEANSQIEQRVRSIISDVRTRGDLALRELAQRFGDPEPQKLTGSELHYDLPLATQELLQRAAANIGRFAEAVAASVATVRVEGEQVVAGMRMCPVDSVACYAPGGRHPLPSTVLMAGLSARAAGVGSVVLFCPSPHPAVLYAAQLIQAEAVYLCGGAQAVAAAAFGTEMVSKVDLVVGPGNAYVTEAKRQLQGTIGIDMLAGPSEVTILADEQANPRWVALDLLAQAEHDPLARVCLVTWSEQLAWQVQKALAALPAEVPCPDFIEESLGGSGLLVFGSVDQALEAVNQLASEHLQLATAEPERYRDRIRHYGGLFLGYRATVPFGDYMAGPNHTLPTGGTARFSAGLSPLTFLRPQCWMTTTDQLGSLAADTASFAELEGLYAHAAAARARL